LLRGCEAVNPSPQGRGFDKAALKLSKSFVVLDDAEYRKKIADDHVSLAFDFPDPANTNAPRTLEKPAWTTLPDPDVVTSLFPEKAAGAGLKIGRATVECVVLPGGALDQCKVIDETPASMGFGESALVVAKVMRVNPWTQQGEPAAGAKVRAPLVFKLSDDPTK
jgi:TonB family protein